MPDETLTYKDLWFGEHPPLEIKALDNPSMRGVDIYVLCGDAVLRGFTLDEIAPGASTMPTFNVGYAQAQALMDSLYRAGLRPSEEGSAGQRAAMQAHIDDLQMVAKDLLMLHACSLDQKGILHKPPDPPAPFGQRKHDV